MSTYKAASTSSKLTILDSGGARGVDGSEVDGRGVQADVVVVQGAAAPHPEGPGQDL